MKNVLNKFNSIVEMMEKVNKTSMFADNAIGFGPRFHKLIHQNNKRVQSIGIYDYYTKKHVVFELVNLVGRGNEIPRELRDMERMVNDARAPA